MAKPVTVVPTRDEFGQTIWVEEKRPLGDVATALTTTQQALTVASNAQNQTGQKPTNDTLNKISAAAGAVAAVAIYIPPPAGPVVSAVAAVVSVAAKVLSGVFGGGPSSAQQLQSLNNTNDDLRAQIATIDDQTAKVKDGLTSMYNALQQNGFKVTPLNGIGDIFSNVQELQLQSQANSSLREILAQKGQQLQSLLQTYVTVSQQVAAATATKSNGRQILLWGMLGLAAIGLGVYTIRELQHKEE